MQMLMILKIDCGAFIIELVPFQVEIDDYKWKIIPGRLLGGSSEALWVRKLPQIGKIRFGSCAGEIAFPHSQNAELSLFVSCV